MNISHIPVPEYAVYVHLLYDKFKSTLIHDMTEVQFADMYAQTVVYGLFSARCMDETQEDFSAAEAVECIGNPPYSTESANKGEWIDGLMATYKTEADGRTRLQEKNSKPLNDGYIKFIRYAQSILQRGGEGILAFINPHGFTDGPIFRGMRSSLMREFNKIYILDLHGNANRQETALNGGKDENVFDIKQGVCILIAVRRANHRSNQLAEVYRADIWGTSCTCHREKELR